MKSKLIKTKNSLIFFGRRLTSIFRSLPSFIILGAQKSGTSSLYNYLAFHPQIKADLKKEIHFFDLNFDKGISWYRAHFPILSNGRYITGEATPYYLFHPLVPGRIKEILSGTKFIVMFRNPIDRAYSHYQHEKRYGREPLSFEDAIEKESERLKGEEEGISADGNYYSVNHHRFSYLARGLYYMQIQRWLQHYPRDQFFFVISEDFYDNPEPIYQRVLQFLKLPEYSPPNFNIYNKNVYTGLSPKVRKKLQSYYELPNKQLSGFLGRELDWQ